MNLMLIAAALFALFKVVDGYKKGMIKEVVSLVTLILMGIMVVLISKGLHSYMEKEVVGVIIAVVLMALLGVVHHLLNVVFLVLEVILTLQIIYVFIMYFGLGMIGQQILEYTRESIVLTKIYQYNVVAKLVENLMNQLPALPL